MGNAHRFLTVFFAASLLGFFACGEEESAEQAAQAAEVEEMAAEVEERRVPVEAVVVRSQIVEQTVPLIGLLQPLQMVEVVAEGQGRVEWIGAELGDAVNPVDTLARIDDRIPLSQYLQTKARVLSAENGLEIARLNFESDGELLENGDISALAYRNAELAVKAAEADRLAALAQLSAAEKQYLDTRITSPISGLIARKYIEMGTMVSPGMPIYRVVDLSSLKVEVGVPQALIGRVRRGSPVRVTVGALNGRGFAGTVRFISPQAEEESGAFAVEIQVANVGDLELRAGMTAEVEMSLSEGQKRLAVPESALVSRNGDRYAYRIEGDRARLTPVAVTEVMGAKAVIGKGLAEGDTIVVVGMKNLGVETLVSIETLY
ncbi:MAG: efflux RND transporter periplasmic adaptor subunit [Gemmatimonadetes bacterium]|jgi:RND family efflux transporter MFP subunit|nr:efflux RND transporter periplasmic adaptor subunit [Gemmatimonadota bacterium]